MRGSHLVILVLAAITAICVVPPRAEVDSRHRLAFTVWGMPFEDRLFEDGYARGFEALHPGVEVKYERYVDVTEKYFAWHLLGTGADVMRVRITDYHALVARGILEPLDRFINDPELGLSIAEQADFFPAIWDQLEIDGERYALPSDNAQYGLYYNKAIFDRYNAEHIDEPLEYPNAAWTWADLLDASRTLTVRDDEGRVVLYGIDFTLWSWPFMAFFAQADGQLWDEEQTTTLIDAPPGLEALQLIVDLLPHAAAMRTGEQVDSATGPDKLFASGQCAMLLDGSWRAPFLELTNPQLDFAIVPLPRHHRAAVVSGSVLWAVGSNSRNKAMAWRMVRWMTDFEQSIRYWDALRVAPPARLSVVHSGAFRSTEGLTDQDGTVLTPSMPPERWNDRGAWLLFTITPDPQTGEMPGFVPVAPYQAELESRINALLNRAVTADRRESLRLLLDDAAASVHRTIDRDRRARGLPPVNRQP